MKTFRNLVLALAILACISAFAEETPAADSKDATPVSGEPAKDTKAKKPAKSRKRADSEHASSEQK